MTSASFYKQDPNNGIYFDIPEYQLGKYLQRRKNQYVSRSVQVDKLVNENYYIKALKVKIQQAYLNKYRAKQMAEKQVSEAYFEAEMIKKKQAEELRQQEIYQHKLEKRQYGKEILRRQMYEKKEKYRYAYEHYLKYKAQVYKVMQYLLNSELKEMEIKDQKKKKAFQDMLTTLRLKYEKRKEYEYYLRKYEEKYMSYLKELDSRSYAVKKVKEEREYAKNKIFERLKLEYYKRRKDVEELYNLRRELYQEYYEAYARRREAEYVQKRYRQRQYMQAAYREVRLRKQQQYEYYQRMYQYFRKQMLEKFAKYDRLEQLAQQKRRMKEQYHKREIEKLWAQKLEAYRVEKAKYMYEVQKLRADRQWEYELIERYKERLLAYHLPNLYGFLPKYLAKKSNSFGQPYRTGYSNKFKL